MKFEESGHCDDYKFYWKKLNLYGLDVIDEPKSEIDQAVHYIWDKMKL